MMSRPQVFFPLPKSDVSRPKYQSWQESRRTLPSLPCIGLSSTAHPALQASYSPTTFAFSYATGARNRTRQFTGAPTDSATLHSSDFGLPASRASTSLRGTRNSKSAAGPPQVGPLKFLRKLHSATYGETFAVTDVGSGRALCVRIHSKDKIVSSDSFSNGLLTELSCYRHISAARAEDRAYLMELLGVLHDEDFVTFAMPLMHGDLFDFIRGRGDRRRTRRWVAQLALGIDALHRMGIIHRDIKPENVLLDMSTDTVRITDFNAAYFQPGNAPLEDGAVYTRLFIGSRPYIAPEVIRRQWYGKMVDWFALGCLVFDLVTGEVLFPDDREKERYMTWNAKEEGLSFLEWAGNLSDQEESIIAGLINVRSQSRLQLARLRQHPFFLDEQGINAFDTLAQPCAFTAPHSQEVHPALKNAPLVGVSPQACNSTQHPYDFRSFEWLNPHGPWKTA